jgi:hypothetical protein
MVCPIRGSRSSASLTHPAHALQRGTAPSVTTGTRFESIGYPLKLASRRGPSLARVAEPYTKNWPGSRTTLPHAVESYLIHL